MTLWWPLDGPDDPDGSHDRKARGAPREAAPDQGGPEYVRRRRAAWWWGGRPAASNGPDGILNATVPDGLREGDTFSLPYVKQVPVAQGVVVARATPAAGGEGEPPEAEPQGGG